MRKTLVLCACLAACGDDDGGTTTATCEEGGTANCFVLPTEAMLAYDATGASSAPNFACAAPTAVDSTQAITVSGTIRHYTSGNGLPGVTMEAYETLAFDTPFASAVSGADGSYTVSFPSGSPSIFHVKGTGSGVVTAYAPYQRIDVTMATITMANFQAPTPDLVDLISGLLEVEAQAGKSLMALIAQDCDGKTLEHAVGTVSTQSGSAAHVSGASIFYTAAGTLPLPVTRDTRTDTSNSGGVAIMNAPGSGTVYGQIWGFVDAADVAMGMAGLTLVAEWQLPAEGDTVVGAPMRPSEGP